jgi:hypothetical protein
MGERRVACQVINKILQTDLNSLITLSMEITRYRTSKKI